MSSKQKKALILILCTAGCFAAAVCMDHWNLLPESGRSWWVTAVYLVPFLLVGAEVIVQAVVNILHGEVFDECFLMALASVTAFALGNCAEAVIVMLFYQIGELFQSCAVSRSRKSIAELMNIRPESANLEINGELTAVDPSSVEVGAEILVKPGERIPLDGTVIDGVSLMDTSALTGESMPQSVSVGSSVTSGCINQTGLLRIRVTRPFAESTVVRILELVESASDRKSKAENFITVFARYYTPSVVGLAVLLAIVPPLCLRGDWADWVMRALNFLVVSCPCALVISVPLTFFGGIGGASRRGILIKGGNYMDVLAKTDTVVFDKTGTLTKGVFHVTHVFPSGVTADTLLLEAAAAEMYSDHPIAHSVQRAAADAALALPEADRLSDAQTIAGYGVSVLMDGERICAGNRKFMQSLGLSPDVPEAIGTVVYLARNGVYHGCIVIADEEKPEAADAIAGLRAVGIRQTVMLTGDTAETAQHLADSLGMDQVLAGLLPDGKVHELEALLAQEPKGKRLAFVGDGINDAPALALADVGIAMGALGSDAAIEASDVVLTDDHPEKVVTAIRIARKTMRIAHQNIAFSLCVKAAILVLSLLGLSGMWLAVFADVGVCILSVLNALRAMQTDRL